MTFASIVQNIVGVVDGSVIPLLYALAFVYLFIGLVRYFFIEEGGSEGREKGKQMLLHGLIGLVVIFAVWGFVNLLLSTLNSAVGAG